MAKRGRPSTTAVADIPVVGPRELCPCGSGKKYRNCHGKTAHRAAAATHSVTARPFAGLPGEPDWVALREIVACASAPVRLSEDADRAVRVVSLLPLASAALVRADGEVWLGLQTLAAGSGDMSHDLGYALNRALAAEPGAEIDAGPAPDDAPRLQDLLDPAAPFEVTVHESFDFWREDGAESDPVVEASLEQANSALLPAARIAGVDGAYWCQLTDRDQVRWVLPQDEEPLLDALARLHVRGESALGPGTRLLGTFRALGLLIPVWDLVRGTQADEVAGPAGEFASRLEAAVAETTPLTAAERGARAGLTNRQVTIR